MKQRYLLVLLTLAAGVALFSSACSDDDDDPRAPRCCLGANGMPLGIMPKEECSPGTIDGRGCLPPQSQSLKCCASQSQPTMYRLTATEAECQAFNGFVIEMPDKLEECLSAEVCCELNGTFQFFPNANHCLTLGGVSIDTTEAQCTPAGDGGVDTMPDQGADTTVADASSESPAQGQCSAPFTTAYSGDATSLVMSAFNGACSALQGDSPSAAIVFSKQADNTVDLRIEPPWRVTSSTAGNVVGGQLVLGVPLNSAVTLMLDTPPPASTTSTATVVFTATANDVTVSTVTINL